MEPAACELLSRASGTLTLDGCSSWLFANVDSRGYYRTSYGAEGLGALGAAVRNNHLTAVEQTSLLEDVWALVRLNQENISSFLSLGQDVTRADIGPAIETIATRVNYESDHMIDDSQRQAFERWVRQLLRPVADKLGWNPPSQERDERHELRAAVLYTLGTAGRDPEVLREAGRRVDMYLGSAGTLDPSLFNTALQLAAVNGDAALYERYLERARGAGGRGGRAGEAIAFRSALAYFADPALRTRTLAFVTSPDVRTQDSPGMLAGLLNRPEAAPDTWEHMKANWDTLQRTGVFQGMRTIIRATNNFCDQTTRNDLDQFFKTHPIGGNERLANQSLETIDRCIAMRTYQAKNLTDFLSKNQPFQP